jgi:hypothetical protein
VIPSLQYSKLVTPDILRSCREHGYTWSLRHCNNTTCSQVTSIVEKTEHTTRHSRRRSRRCCSSRTSRGRPHLTMCSISKSSRGEARRATAQHPSRRRPCDPCRLYLWLSLSGRHDNLDERGTRIVRSGNATWILLCHYRCRSRRVRVSLEASGTSSSTTGRYGECGPCECHTSLSQRPPLAPSWTGPTSCHGTYVAISQERFGKSYRELLSYDFQMLLPLLEKSGTKTHSTTQPWTGRWRNGILSGTRL